MNNVALNKTATADSFILPYSPDRAVNGETFFYSRWTTSQVPGWLCIDLGGYYWVNRWVVKNMGSIGWPSPGYNTKGYKLQSSLDNANWTDRDSVANNTANSTDRTVPPFKARYVRVYVSQGLNINLQVGAIAELELYDVPPTSSNLSALTVSSGQLIPDFSKDELNYTVTLDYDAISIAVTPTVEESRATVKVNGTPVVSGQSSAQIPLNPGQSNMITVAVTPYIGDTRNYMINAVRGSSPYLSNLLVKAGMSTLILNPQFSSRITSYETNAAEGTKSVNIIPTAEGTGATIKVNGTVVQSGSPINILLKAGDNNVLIEVKPSVGSQSVTYNVNVKAK